MTTLLAVDGNSLGHRAWHALRRSRLSGAWVTHGVVRMLASAWSYGPFDGVYVAFDSATSYRRDSYPEYKANRDPHDPELYEQFDRLSAILTDCGFAVGMVEGYEADDLLAAAAAAAEGSGIACSVLSSDRDLLSLVSDTVTLLRPRATMSDLTVYGPDAVLDEFGVRPHQYLELAALRGDTSDNLDGVHGVGAKTAAKLISSWGSVDALYAGLQHLPSDLSARLREAEEDVARNLALMSPLTNHPVDVAAIVDRGVDVEQVTTALDGARLRQAATDLRLAIERGPMPPAPPPPEVDPAGSRFAPPRQEEPAPVHYVGEQVGLFG